MIPYRVTQVWNFIRRRPAAEDVAWVEARLSPDQQALFFSQEAGDQAHAVEVARTLVDQGARDGRLIRAALLHDAGKAPGVPLRFRILAHLLKRIAPGRLDRLPPDRQGWLAPLARFHHHPAIGARRARGAGCHPDTITLIEYHQRHDVALGDELQGMLETLQAVDDAS